MLKKIKIVIIDDDADFLELVDYNLRITGFQVFRAESGKEGLELVYEEKPGVILLDTTMPEMDGLEVLNELKHDIRACSIPVFMLTGKTIIGDIERAFDLGADDYITKPVELKQLGKIIKKKLKKHYERQAENKKQ
jgi:DNA-binding response OmpR family regulator